jgi:hypothetical protein
MKTQLQSLLVASPLNLKLSDIDGMPVIYLNGHRDSWALEIFPSKKTYTEEGIDGTVTKTTSATFAYSVAFDLQEGGQAHEEETIPQHFLDLKTCLHAGLCDMVSRNLALHLGLV